MSVNYYKNLEISTLTVKQATEMLNQLNADLKHYSELYYNYDTSAISDGEYDFLLGIYNNIETKFPNIKLTDSISTQVGANMINKFGKIEHLTPMLSLGNLFSSEDLKDFIERVQRFLMIDYMPSTFCEPKIDGLSFSLTYLDGNLLSGATRGNGLVGEDVTTNIKMLDNIPLILKNAPHLLEIRGEIYMEKNAFATLNLEQEKLGENKFASPRNAASGSLRQLDPSVTKARQLKYFAYAMITDDSNFCHTQNQCLEKLTQLGFNTNPLCKLANTQNDIVEFYNTLMQMRSNLPYEIDGVVYKINDFHLQQRLGFIAKNPRYAVAHKFPAEIGKTKLLDITLQVGRMGTLTPVAELEPIVIGGVKVARASLHNYQEIKKKDIRINDYVYLERAGDVIPYILGVELLDRTSEVKAVQLPLYCPSCNSQLKYSNDDIIIRCNNKINCPAQIHEGLCHFVSKNALNIDSLGKKQLEFLIAKKLITNHIDIFTLEERNNNSLSKLEFMDGWGEKSVKNLFYNIKKAQNNLELYNFIYSLGIDHIGISNAKLLAKEFRSGKNFLQAMKALTMKDIDVYQQINRIDGIGEKILNDIYNFFEFNLSLTEQLINILNIQDYQEKNKVTSLTGKQIIFTGTLTTISRQEAKAKAEAMGAKIVSSVSKNTDLIIAGNDAGSKLKRGIELGIKIIDEVEWERIMATNIS